MEITPENVQDVASNEKNEHHAALYDESHPSHLAVKSAVEKAWALKDPALDKRIRENQQIDAWSGAQKEPDRQPSENSGQAAPDQGGADRGELSPVDIEVDQLLTARWGEAYTENFQAAGEALRAIFPDVESMVEAIEALGIDKNPQAMADIMSTLAKTKKRGW